MCRRARRRVASDPSISSGRPSRKCWRFAQSRTAVSRESSQRQAEIRRVADGLFDFKEMARLSLSRHWSGQSLREQEEFVGLFTELLERSFLSTIENYAGEKIVFLGESIDGSYAKMRSRITTERRMEISIDYRLIDRGDRWGVYDVVLGDDSGQEVVDATSTPFTVSVVL